MPTTLLAKTSALVIHFLIAGPSTTKTKEVQALAGLLQAIGDIADIMATLI
jgi:hypothetical protein